MLNTEQALTRVLQIVHALDEGEAAIYNAVSKNPYEWKSAVGPIPQLYFLEQDLRRTLVEEAAAKSGNRCLYRCPPHLRRSRGQKQPPPR